MYTHIHTGIAGGDPGPGVRVGEPDDGGGDPPLCYTMLYYDILYYTILYYTILLLLLHSTILYYTILYYTIL